MTNLPNVTGMLQEMRERVRVNVTNVEKIYCAQHVQKLEGGAYQ